MFNINIRNLLNYAYSNSKRGQGSLEYAIIAAIVVIAAITIGILVYTSTSKSTLGSNAAILAAGVNTAASNSIILALNSPLPSGATSFTVSVSAGTFTAGSLGSPTYVDNYPEYVIGTMTGVVANQTTISSFGYTTAAGKIVSTPTQSGSPLVLIGTASNTIQP